MIANTPQTSYYAVIFSTLLTDNNEGYSNTAAKMEDLTKLQPGYLGIESAREELGITVSYWESLEAIKHWKNNIEHTLARDKGRAQWYKKYKLRISKVEHDYGFEK